MSTRNMGLSGRRRTIGNGNNDNRRHRTNNVKQPPEQRMVMVECQNNGGAAVNGNKWNRIMNTEWKVRRTRNRHVKVMGSRIE